jgi:HAE1 family hydrophobic/amphiphilic exporter-1
VVRLRQEDRERAEDINAVRISTPQGQVLEAKNLVTLRTQSGPTEIQRKNQQRVARVNAEPEVPLSDAIAAVNLKIPQMGVPQGFTVGFGAEAEAQAQAFSQLQWMLLLSIILVYAVMASQYESLRDPFIIMFSVPLSAIGVVLALKLTDTTFSLQAYIGVIMLGGIVVNNAILLVDYTNVLRRRDGMGIREAVETADVADDLSRPDPDVARDR